MEKLSKNAAPSIYPGAQGSGYRPRRGEPSTYNGNDGVDVFGARGLAGARYLGERIRLCFALAGLWRQPSFLSPGSQDFRSLGGADDEVREAFRAGEHYRIFPCLRYAAPQRIN